MELRHLRYFVAMADTGSLMKAAERLHVAQPALSVHLANLEGELGTKLVTRSNRGVTLTEDGAVLYERAVQILRYQREMIVELKGRNKKPSGRVSVGMLSTMPALMSHRLCQSVRERLPDVRLYLLEASSWALYEWLLEGRIDMAMLFSLPDMPELETIPLLREDFYLVGPGHEVGGKAEVQFEDLLNYRLATSSPTSTWRKALDDAAERHGRAFTPQIETESVQALKALAMSGECHSLMPGSCIIEEARLGLLTARRVIDPEMQGTMSLASLASRPLGLAAAGVRDIIREIAETLTDEMRLPVPNAAASIIRATPTAFTPANERGRPREAFLAAG